MVFSSIISHFKKRFFMNLVSIVMQCFSSIFPPLILEFLILGKRIKQNPKFCENLVHLQISLKKEILYSFYVVFKYIFKEAFFCISSSVTSVPLLCV